MSPAGTREGATRGAQRTVRLLPNMVTIMALCLGLTSVRFAVDGRLGAALAMIVAAACLDGLDGRLARMLDATSKMGEELDSLADSISFGVAPALVLYFGVFHDSTDVAPGTWLSGVQGLGWFVALMYATSIVLRLARFNTLLEDPDQPSFSREFFVGVPAPAAAILALLPVIVSLEFGDGWWVNHYVAAGWILASAALAFSRIPTLSFKKLAVRPALAPLLLILIAAGVALLLTQPLMLLGILAIAYLAHIPFALRQHRWLRAHPEAWDVTPRDRRTLRRYGELPPCDPAAGYGVPASSTAQAARQERRLRRRAAGTPGPRRPRLPRRRTQD